VIFQPQEEMNKRERDRITALVWLVVAIAICFGSVRLSLGNFHHPGPGFFSFVSGAVLGILSLVVFFQSLRKQAGDKRKAFWPNPGRGLKMTYVVIALILYAIGMNYLGFSLATLLFLGFLLRGIDPQRWRVVFAWSILGTIICWGIFKYWLDVQLPGGIVGF
jgi:putative tricarboxylic transport membrane protein